MSCLFDCLRGIPCPDISFRCNSSCFNSSSNDSHNDNRHDNRQDHRTRGEEGVSLRETLKDSSESDVELSEIDERAHDIVCTILDPPQEAPQSTPRSHFVTLARKVSLR